MQKIAFCIVLCIVVFIVVDLFAGNEVTFDGQVIDKVFQPEQTSYSYHKGESVRHRSQESFTLMVSSAGNVYEVTTKINTYYAKPLNAKVTCSGYLGRFTHHIYFISVED